VNPPPERNHFQEKRGVQEVIVLDGGDVIEEQVADAIGEGFEVGRFHPVPPSARVSHPYLRGRLGTSQDRQGATSGPTGVERRVRARAIGDAIDESREHPRSAR
jgi:hypothetical protein